MKKPLSSPSTSYTSTPQSSGSEPPLATADQPVPSEVKAPTHDQLQAAGSSSSSTSTVNPPPAIANSTSTALAKTRRRCCSRRSPRLITKLKSLKRTQQVVVLGGGILFLLFTLVQGPWLYGVLSGVILSHAGDWGLVSKHTAPIIQKPLVIAVMGMTGVGKSTFIKELTKDANITVSDSLESCTDAIQHASLSLQTETGLSYNVILADTPGFDDSRSGRTDYGILEDIADWLIGMYDTDTKLTGIIYLYRITDDRLAGSSARNLKMMRDLVGEENMENVMLVTTRWEVVATNPNELAKAEARELQLRNNTDGKEGFWYDLINTHGASYARHDGSYNSAKSILSRIVNNSPVFIKLQDELAQGLQILETTAGNAVLSKMEKESLEQAKRMERFEKEIRELAEERVRLVRELQEGLNQEREKGEEMREKLRRRLKENEEIMRETQEEYGNVKEIMKVMEEELRRLRDWHNNRGFFTKMGEKMDNLFTSGERGEDSDAKGKAKGQEKPKAEKHGRRSSSRDQPESIKVRRQEL